MMSIYFRNVLVTYDVKEEILISIYMYSLQLDRAVQAQGTEYVNPDHHKNFVCLNPYE